MAKKISSTKREVVQFLITPAYVWLKMVASLFNIALTVSINLTDKNAEKVKTIVEGQ